MTAVGYGKKQVRWGVELKENKRSSGAFLELGAGSAGPTDQLLRAESF